MAQRGIQRQQVQTPEFMVSSFLSQYANGTMDCVYSDGIFNQISERDKYQIISGDPSVITRLNLDFSHTTGIIAWRIRPKSETLNTVTQQDWDYYMKTYFSTESNATDTGQWFGVLGHDIYQKFQDPEVRFFSGVDINDDDPEEGLQILEYFTPEKGFGSLNTSNGSIESNGWFIGQSSDQSNILTSGVWVGMEISCASIIGNSLNLGMVSFGNYWRAPQNCDLNSSVDTSWNTKQTKTLKGKTISQMVYDRPNHWLLSPWELRTDIGDSRATSNFMQPNGVRSWRVNFSYLEAKYTMPQFFGFYGKWVSSESGTGQTSDDLNPTGSKYNSWDGTDFQTRVLGRTLGNHLPCIMHIHQYSHTDSFAFIRLDKRYKVKQITPELYNIGLKAEEQI